MIHKYKTCAMAFGILFAALLLMPFTALAQEPLSCGTTITGSTPQENPDEVDEYTFTLDAEDRVRIIAYSNQIFSKLELYDSSGLVDSVFTNSLPDSVKLEKTLDPGDYTLKVSCFNSSPDPLQYFGEYELTWNRVNNPCGGTPPLLDCGQEQAGSLAAGTEEDFYTIAANVGDTLRVVSHSGSINPSLGLYNSTGTKSVGTG
jgi:hypothetical protein